MDKELQIIHADVRMEVNGETVIDEPLCVDVGLLALVLSAFEDVHPDRWAGANIWHKAPFFCCGCGDPECRAYSFAVRHLGDGHIELAEWEERKDHPPRLLERYLIAENEYTAQVVAIGRAFLEFVEGLDYQPLYKDTVATVRNLLQPYL